MGAPNRLIHEKSPYLLQHAYNPVDWFPWGEEAFQKARNEDKPIFLSVGYSSCHWCHVMERESFQNEEVAELLNRDFVPVKVDREERPDVDRIYMTFVQAVTGSGGWPMSVFLTPEGKPFYGGTYFPPERRYGRPSFRDVLHAIAHAWRHDRERVSSVASQALEHLRRWAGEGARAGAFAPLEAADSAFQIFRRTFDRQHGGFGDAPKFPRPAVLQFLLRFWERTGREEAREMALATLRAMARGGIRDHLGGGFHRYSVDEAWRVPHFEKMLYDQAQLAACYLEGFQVSGEALFADVAVETLKYVLEQMRDPEGGFYSAEDADSAPDPARPHETEEGAFYLWTAAEIREALGEPLAGWFCAHYGVDSEGQWVLCEAQTLDETAALAGLKAETMASALADARRRLLARRNSRPRPGRDEKILTAWNGLMISALARAARVLGADEYLDAAAACARFIERRLCGPRGLWRRYCRGDAGVPAFLEDYAFLVQGLLDLYEAVLDEKYLSWAVRLAEEQSSLFEDPVLGGFFSAREDPALPLRIKDDYDGAEPSANSVSAWNALRLAALTGRDAFGEQARRTITAFGRQLVSQPDSMPLMLAAALYQQAGLRQVVLHGDAQDLGVRRLRRVVDAGFFPDVVVLRAPSDAPPSGTGDTAPQRSAAVAHVCENFSCQAPVGDPQELAQQLRSKSGIHSQLIATNSLGTNQETITWREQEL